MQESGPYAGITKELSGTAFAAIRYLPETASTNSDAAALLGSRDAAGLTIVAERQTQGMGRKGRMWTAAPQTSLLFTTILPNELPSAHLWVVPFWTVLAAHRALRELGIDTAVVWPNDLLLAGGKVGGVLCTSRVSGDLAWAACGIGINVHRSGGAAADIHPAPAFCDDAARVKRPELLRAMLLALDASLDLLDNPQRIARLWETAADVPGRRYRLLKDGESDAFEATALGLANGGGLIVARENGARETVSLADARALR